MTKAAEGVRWNLADLYASPDDPAIERDLELAEEKAVAFESAYRPLMAHPDAGTVARLIADLKAVATLLTRAGAYASLYFSEHTNSEAAGAFYQKIQEKLTRIQSRLIFFSVLWNRLDESTVRGILDDPLLEKDRHYLAKKRAFAPYMLGEAEEKILSLKQNTGREAFTRLFDEVINNIVFTVRRGGKEEPMTESAVLALLHSPDREERRQASLSLAEGLEKNSRLLTYIYNMVLADHRQDMQLRRYKHPADARNLSNEASLESLLGLVGSVKAAYPLAQRYYRMKTRILGLDKMFDYDRYAPADPGEAAVPFERCREIVLEGYYGFSEEAGKITEEFFDKRWIDAEVRPGKRGGGFSALTVPEVHPYILVNYTGSMRDVMTVAHELGHGLHQYLASKRVGILEAGAPLTMAETASVFGEMLVFEKILEGEKDPLRRLALLCSKIDDNFATVYRQIAMTDFELMAHDAGLREGELPAEKLSDLWMKANEDFYGGSVELTPAYRQGWKYIPHFVHSPFYCYAYAYAQLFVLSLYRKYRQEKGNFVPLYLDILSLGGSKRPDEIASMAGLDINHPGFWKTGLAILEELVVQAEELQQEVSSSR